MQRHALGLLALLVLAPFAIAQETYSISANANQVADLTLAVTGLNGRTCEKLNLAATCTQAQACTAANAPGGSSCTANQARGANVRIYPNTQAGREEFVTFELTAPSFRQMRTAVVGRHYGDLLCSFWRNPATTRTQKDAACTAAGNAVNCELCE